MFVNFKIERVMEVMRILALLTKSRITFLFCAILMAPLEQVNADGPIDLLEKNAREKGPADQMNNHAHSQATRASQNSEATHTSKSVRYGVSLALAIKIT